MLPHRNRTPAPKSIAVGLALVLTPIFAPPVAGGEARQARLPALGTEAVVIPTEPGSPKSGGKALLMALRILRGPDQRAKANPVTIQLEPGVYDIGEASLNMMPGVDIVGSGMDETVIVGLGQSFGSADFSFNEGVVVGADGAELRDLTVRCENTEELDTCITMANHQASPSLENVRLMAVDPAGGGHWGLRNNESSPALADVEIVVAKGANNYGLVNVGTQSRPDVRRTTITATGGAGDNVGILNKLEGLPVRLTSVDIVATGGFRAVGIQTLPPGDFLTEDFLTEDFLTEDSLAAKRKFQEGLNSMKLVNVEISALDASQSYGFFEGRYLLDMRNSRVIADDSAIDIAPQGDVVVRGSELEATEFFVRAVNARITGSTLLGGADVLALEAECSGITTETGTQDSCP